MMFGFGSFNLINEFKQDSNEPNAEQLGSVTALSDSSSWNCPQNLNQHVIHSWK